MHSWEGGGYVCSCLLNIFNFPCHILQVWWNAISEQVLFHYFWCFFIMLFFILLVYCCISAPFVVDVTQKVFLSFIVAYLISNVLQFIFIIIPRGLLWDENLIPALNLIWFIPSCEYSSLSIVLISGRTFFYCFHLSMRGIISVYSLH